MRHNTKFDNVIDNVIGNILFSGFCKRFTWEGKNTVFSIKNYDFEDAKKHLNSMESAYQRIVSISRRYFPKSEKVKKLLKTMEGQLAKLEYKIE